MELTISCNCANPPYNGGNCQPKSRRMFEFRDDPYITAYRVRDDVNCQSDWRGWGCENSDVATKFDDSQTTSTAVERRQATWRLVAAFNNQNERHPSSRRVDIVSGTNRAADTGRDHTRFEVS